MKPNNTALRKRTQISNANRTMFIWIAGASALVGFAVVASIFLAQKLIFNEKVLSEKNHTSTTLDSNNAVIEKLKANVRALDTNIDLAKVKANPGDQTIRVILDALPSDANSLALGSSLQSKLLAIPGLKLNSLQVDPVSGVESLTGVTAVPTAPVASSATTTASQQITFQFSVEGSQDLLLQALTNVERSIRTIDITRLQIDNQGSVQVMTVQGRAFYEPVKTIIPYDKTVKP